MIHTENKTEAQICNEVKRQVNAYLKEKKLPEWFKVRVVRGTYHLDNISEYFYLISLSQLLEQVTGLKFNHMTASMARRSR